MNKTEIERTGVPNDSTDLDYQELGHELATFLNLRMTCDGNRMRFQTTWGTKSQEGLARCVVSIIEKHVGKGGA